MVEESRASFQQKGRSTLVLGDTGIDVIDIREPVFVDRGKRSVMSCIWLFFCVGVATARVDDARKSTRLAPDRGKESQLLLYYRAAVEKAEK